MSTLPIAESIVSRYTKTGVAVDTELLLLLAVGRYEREYLASFKRTARFSGDDYDVLSSFLAKFSAVITSPHVFTEVSNYSFQIPEGRLEGYLGSFVAVISRAKEIYVTKDTIISHSRFSNVGATDTGLIISCVQGSYLLLTTDHKLCGLAKREGVEALHFDELRGYSWFLEA